MKNTKGITGILAILACVGMFISCKEQTQKPKKETMVKHEAKAEKEQSEAPLTAMVNGKRYEAMGMVTRAKKMAMGSFTKLTITSSSEEGEGITLEIANFQGEGEYSFDLATLNKDNPIPNKGLFLRTDDNGAQIWAAESGTIVVTMAQNDKVSGTFSFTTKNGTQQGDPVNVTDGHFQVRVK